MEAQDDPDFRAILNNALLTTPDGMPMVWMGKLQGQASIARVYGPDLMLNLCEHSRTENFSHFFYGGIAGVAFGVVSVHPVVISGRGAQAGVGAFARSRTPLLGMQNSIHMAS